MRNSVLLKFYIWLAFLFAFMHFYSRMSCVQFLKNSVILDISFTLADLVKTISKRI